MIKTCSYAGLCIAFFLSAAIQAQDTPRTEEDFDREYARRIVLAEIDGVYIPKDLDDAFAELRRLASPADLDKFKSAPEDAVRRRLHFGLGRWIIYNWGFYEGSRLSHSFHEMGLLHPDDMARVILVTFHRHLNGAELLLQEEIDHYRTLREAEAAERLARREIIHEERRPPKIDE